MTDVILDTDAFSRLADGRGGGAALAGRLAGLRTVLAFPTVAELHYGARLATWGDTRLRRLEQDIARHGVLRPTDAVLRRWGALRADAVRVGHPLGQEDHVNDLWIAACAVHHGVPLLTGNVRHFAGLPGLTVLPAG